MEDGGNGSTSVPHADRPVAPGRDALLKHASDWLAFTAHYWSARLDRMVVSVRDGALTGAILGVLGILGLATAIICLVLLLQGFAGGLGAALGDRLWGGQLIVGGGILLLMIAAAVIALAILNSRLRHARVEKYERLKGSERARLGRDVDSAARATE